MGAPLAATTKHDAEASQARESRPTYDLTVVIPVFNEEGNILVLAREIDAALSGKFDYEIIFVDDGSTDLTREEIQKLVDAGKARALILTRNFGQSAALAAGIDAANGEFLITMDGDLQNDPADIPFLVERLQDGYDVICGWRTNRKDSYLKRYLSKAANWLRRHMTNEPIHDSGCTLRAYRKHVFDELQLFGEMHRFIPALLYWRGFRIGETPTNHRARVHGRTKYGWSRLIKGILDLIVVAFWQRFSLRPIHVFGLVGLVLMLFGASVTAFLIGERVFFNSPLADRPLLIVSLIMVVVGTQFIGMGLLADIQVRTYYSIRKIKSYAVKDRLGGIESPRREETGVTL